MAPISIEIIVSTVGKTSGKLEEIITSGNEIDIARFKGGILGESPDINR